MSETSEVQWQPARLVPRHSLGQKDINPEKLATAKALVVRLRPSHRPTETLSIIPCDCAKWYEVHPDDVEKITGYHLAANVCEGDILID
jgi:hypothetical protein